MRDIVENKTRAGSDDEKRFNIAFWRSVAPGIKLVAAWEMVGELKWFKGETNAGESRLQRSVERLERRIG